MKYQIRKSGPMSDEPMSILYDSLNETQSEVKRIAAEAPEEWTVEEGPMRKGHPEEWHVSAIHATKLFRIYVNWIPGGVE